MKKGDALRERYETVMGAINESVYDWDLVRDTFWTSESMQRLLGLSPEHITLEGWRKSIHPDDYARFREGTIAHLKGETERFECDYRFRSGDGTWHWARTHGLAVRDARGRALRMVGSTGDITALKQAELEQVATAGILKAMLGSPTEVGPVFEAILANALRLCDASFAAVFTYDGELIRNVAHLNASQDFARFLGSGGVRPSRETTTRRCVLERRTIHTADLMNDPEFSPPEAQRREKVRTSLSVPMFRESTLVGVISLWRPEVRPFTDKQIVLVETFAAQAAIALENVRLFNETREALDQQIATAEILSVISRSPTDTKPVFDAIVQSGLKLFSDAAISIALPDGAQVRAAAVAESDAQRAAAWRSRFPFPLTREYMHGIAILERRLVDLPDVRDAPPELAAGSRNFLASGYRAITIMPMMHGERAIGALSVVRLAPGPLSAKQLVVLKTFADQAVIAVENVRLFNETREALEQQTATAEILEITARSPSDVQPVFDAIARNAMRLCDGAHCALFRFDGRLQHFAAHCGVDAQTVDLLRRIYPREPDPARVSGRAILQREVIHVADALSDPRFPGSAETLTSAGNRAVLAAPMLKGGEPIGVIFMVRREPRRFTERQVALLRTFADQAVIALESVRLFNETREALEQQRASAEVLGVISSSLADTAPVFERILESCERLFAGRIVGLNLLGADNLMRIGAYHGPHREQFERIFPVGPGRSIAERRVIQYPDTEHGPDVPSQTREGCRAIGVRSVIFAPVLWEDRALGNIFVAREHVSTFSEKESALLKTFADQAAIAIENVRLFKETQESLDQQKALAEVLGTLSRSVADAKPVFDLILDSCQRLFEGYLVGMTLVGDDGQVHLGAYQGENKEQMEAVYPYPLGRDSGSGQSILDRKVVHFPDVDAPDSAAPRRVMDGARAVGFKSIIFAPMIDEERAVGALWVARRLPGPFSERETALLKSFADQAVIAIRNARLFNEILEKSAQLEVASRHKSEFLASMSHELRTPLNAIIGFARIVMRQSKDALAPKQYDNLEKILTSGQRLLGLINAVLDLSKVEAGRIELHPRELELAPVLDECLRTIEPLVKVALVKEFDGALPSMYVDDEKLRQVVMNLLSNAAKFTERGTIRLRAQADNGAVAITVADTGIGIAAEKLDMIFHEFEQADAGATRGYGGTGLGLAIARRLARLMGGDIGVESTPGVGSRFTLTLPVRYAS